MSAGVRCPHGWTVLLPDFRCPRASCPANMPSTPPSPVPPKTLAQAIRWREQTTGAQWSEWHVFARLEGTTRGTRCRQSVDVGGRFSVERAAIARGPGRGKCEGCFA